MNENFGEVQFQDEDVSEVELGMEPTAVDTGNAGPEGTPEGTTDNPPQDSDLKGEPFPEGEGEEKPQGNREPGEEGNPSEAGEGRKPPKGFVPVQAIREAREKNRQHLDRIAELEAALAQQQQSVTGNINPDFKILSKEEMQELSLEDPEAFAGYLSDLVHHQSALREADQSRSILGAISETEQSVIAASSSALQRAIPDLFQEGGGYNPEVESALISHADTFGGIDVQTLSVLTNPQTRIVTPDGKTVLLGHGATGLTQLLYNSQKLASANDPAALRAEIEAELRPQIAREEAARLTNKLKKPQSTTGDTFQSLGSAPGRGETFSIAPESEDDWSRMSDEDEERWLRGG